MVVALVELIVEELHKPEKVAGSIDVEGDRLVLFEADVVKAT